jgi:hypothetical protein
MRTGMRIQSRRRAARTTAFVSRLVSLLGCTLTLQATPAAAQERGSVPPSRAPFPAAPPWSGDGEGTRLSSTRARVTLPAVRHRAIHPARVGPTAGPLFPRAQQLAAHREAREASMRRHPAGKGLDAREDEGPTHPSRTRASSAEAGPPAPSAASAPDERAPRVTRADPGRDDALRCGGQKQVEVGDTLWDIGSAVIHAQDDAEVAAYVRRLHDENRNVIGDDPDLILPGQRLRLPDCER